MLLATQVYLYSLSLLSYFGEPVRLEPFASNLQIIGGPGTVVGKKADYLEIVSETDDPYCIFDRSFAVRNPYLRFGVPLVFALLTFAVAQRVRPREFRFWRDLQGKKSSSGADYQALNGLRGLAAFLVMLDHSGVPGCDGIGNIGVVMFFSLSGFLLSVPFAKDGSKILNVSAVQDYFLRRVKRIAPMFYAMILVGYVLNQRIEDAIRSALFLQGDSIYWTVLQETHFYLLLPLVMLVNHLFLRNNKLLIVIFLLAITPMHSPKTMGRKLWLFNALYDLSPWNGLSVALFAGLRGYLGMNGSVNGANFQQTVEESRTAYKVLLYRGLPRHLCLSGL